MLIPFYTLKKTALPNKQLYCFLGDASQSLDDAKAIIREKLPQLSQHPTRTFILDTIDTIALLTAEFNQPNLFEPIRWYDITYPKKTIDATLKKFFTLPFNNENTYVFLNAPLLTTKLFQSLSFPKNTVIITFDSLSNQQLKHYLDDILLEKAIVLSTEAMDFIYHEGTERSLWEINQWIEKLALLPKKAPISLESLLLFDSHIPTYELYSLRESILKRDFSTLQRQLHFFEQKKDEAPLILWHLSHLFSTLLMLKTGMLQQRQAIFKAQHIWGAQQSLFLQALPHFTLDNLKGAIVKIATLDYLLKSFQINLFFLELKCLLSK